MVGVLLAMITDYLIVRKRQAHTLFKSRTAVHVPDGLAEVSPASGAAGLNTL
jgi:hypothetical protein